MTKKKMVLMVFLTLMLVGCATTKGDWERAQNLNTVHSYQEFLNKHLQGEFSRQAKDRIEQLQRREAELVWEKAQSANTIEVYITFMKKYPMYFKKEVSLKIKTLLKDTLKGIKNVQVKISEPFRYVSSITYPGQPTGPGNLRAITGAVSNPDWVSPVYGREKESYKKQLKTLIEKIIQQHGYNISISPDTTLHVFYSDMDSNRLPAVLWLNGELDGIYKEYTLRLRLLKCCSKF